MYVISRIFLKYLDNILTIENKGYYLDVDNVW